MKFLAIIILLFLSACQKPETDPVLYGYVEGRLVHIAPIASGRLIELNVREGDLVKSGQKLFAIDPSRAQAILKGAISANSAAVFRLTDLQKAGRPQEIRAGQQNLARLQAALKLADENLQRTQTLVSKNILAPARLDADQANFDAAKAAVEEAKARLAILRQPARPDQIASARAEQERLQAQVLRAQLNLDEHQVAALQTASVQTIYRRVGELAGPNQPVLALLAKDALRIRFFVPETRLQEVQAEKLVQLACDGCAAGLSGKITFISAQSEFTPPVIFTQKQRAKLMWMVEVKPNDPSAFALGQPVEVRW